MTHPTDGILRRQAYMPPSLPAQAMHWRNREGIALMSVFNGILIAAGHRSLDELCERIPQVRIANKLARAGFSPS